MAPDRDHGGLGGRDLAGDDALQPGHHVRGHQHRVDGGLGAGTVAALAVQGHPHGVGGGHDRPARVADHPRGQRADVLAEHDARHRKPLEQAVA